jgi:hypothetical protein
MLGAVVLAAAALFHAVACFVPVAQDSPPWRHALFALIDAAVALGLIFRPRGFALVFGFLVAQQLLSHGAALWHAFATEGRVDWISVGVLLTLPALLVALLRSGPARAD